MNRFFTSDHHFSHTNIIKLANRMFVDAEEMNEFMIGYWNAIVKPEDIVYHLGDFALGPIADSLPMASKLNGYKVLIPGNHDRIFKGNKKKEINKFRRKYEQQFNSIWVNGGALTIGGINVLLSHFPYDSDSHGEDRYKEYRFKDNGIPIIHGHIHSNKMISRSENGTLQIHVGVDAHNYLPVPEKEIYSLIRQERVQKIMKTS